jgi:hypothetical protein
MKGKRLRQGNGGGRNTTKVPYVIMKPIILYS